MLLLERDPLVLTDWSRDVQGADVGSPGSQHHAPRRVALFLWTAVVALMHFDRGAATVAAMDIAAWDGYTVSLSFGYVVALLAWHSVGLAFGSIFAGFVFQRASAKLVILLALLANAAALLAVSLQAELHLVALAFLRFASGVAASMPFAFLPLWVDFYSPSEAQAQWMAVVQLGAPVGQFLGILVAGVTTVAFRSSRGWDWRSALFCQALAIAPFILRLMCIPAQQVDVADVASLRARLDSLTPHTGDGGSAARELHEMMQGVSRNPLNVSLSATLCFLYSTAAGLALWSAPYLALTGGAPGPLATLLVVAVTLSTAPAVGTYAGALLCDRLDGFRAGRHAVALRVASGFIVLAAIPGPLSAGVHSFGPRLLLIWVWLLGAGAFLPISAGILMTSMPSYLRSFSTASSSLVFHLLGFTVVPVVSAVLMSCFGRPDEGLDFGVCFSLWMTVPAAVLLLLAYAREPKTVPNAGICGADDLTFSEISYELSRRRMSTAPL